MIELTHFICAPMDRPGETQEFWGYRARFDEAWIDYDFGSEGERTAHLLANRKLLNAGRDMTEQAADVIGVYLLFLGSGWDHEHAAAETRLKENEVFMAWLKKHGISLEQMQEFCEELHELIQNGEQIEEAIQTWKKERGIP